MTQTCGMMIDGLQCWQFILMMTVIIVLLVVPVVSWIIHRRLRSRQSKAEPVPPLMYITAVSAARTSDVDIPYLPSPGETNFLPPSYEDICKNAATNNHLSVSSMSLNVDEELPEYTTGVCSQRSSMVLSTFYSDANSGGGASETASNTNVESDSETDCTSQSQGPTNETLEADKTDMGVFIA